MIRLLILAVLCVLLKWEITAAQEPTDTDPQRNDCRLAAQVIEAGHPATHSEWAREYNQMWARRRPRSRGSSVRFAP